MSNKEQQHILQGVSVCALSQKLEMLFDLKAIGFSAAIIPQSNALFGKYASIAQSDMYSADSRTHTGQVASQTDQHRLMLRHRQIANPSSGASKTIQ
jgi:hypothetical protein